MCGTGCCELNPNPLQKEEKRGRELFKTVQSSISLMSFRILAFLFPGLFTCKRKQPVWTVTAWQGVELGVKNGGTAVIFYKVHDTQRFSKSYSKYSTSHGISFTTTSLSYKAFTLI